MDPKKAEDKANTKLRKRRQPVFKTLNGRVVFTVLSTVLLLVAAGSYAAWNLGHGYWSDAIAANARTAAAATAEASTAIGRTRRILTELGDAAAHGGAVTVDCAGLVASAASRQPFSDIGLATPSGAVLCDSRGGAGLPGASWTAFLAATAKSGAYAFEIVDDAAGGKEIIFAYPAPDVRGAINTVAFAVLDSVTLGANIAAQDGYIIGMADKRGHVVISLELADGRPVPAGEPASGLAVEMLSRKNGSAELKDPDGTKRIYSFRGAAHDGYGNLYFFAGGDFRTVFQESDRGAWRGGLAAGLLILIATLLMLTVGGFIITDRVRKLARAITAVVRGERDPETLPYGLGELDGVTKLYEEMAVKLKQTLATMDQKIKTRTSALEFSKGISELDRARTETLLASIGEGVIAADRDDRISFINDVAREALWWTPDKVINSFIHASFRLEDEKQDIVAPENWPTKSVLKSGKTLVTSAPTKPFYLRRHDKSRFPVKVTVSPTVIDGETVGTLVTFDDITDEVEFDRRKSEFISVASHQLRSPIAALRWMIDMLNKGDVGELTPKQKDWAQKLSEAGDKMNALIDELLNISRVEAGVKVTSKEVDTAGFVDGILKDMAPLLLEKKQRYAFTKTDLPKLTFDPMMIGEVLKNFISNASKYSPEGSDIGVAVTASPAEMKFAVTDRGIGIPKTDHNQMFNKYFRAENALKGPVTGTGLGLYYCKSAVELHGGEIGFDSEEGKGSTFWFTLPIR